MNFEIKIYQFVNVITNKNFNFNIDRTIFKKKLKIKG